MEAISLCFSFLSLSAVLASISVALRNFALTALLQEGIERITIGEGAKKKKYEDVLRKSVVVSTIAGIVFIINAFAAFFISVGVIYYNFNNLSVIFISLSIILLLGITLFLICLCMGHLNLKFSTPERPPIQPQAAQQQNDPPPAAH